MNWMRRGERRRQFGIKIRAAWFSLLEKRVIALILIPILFAASMRVVLYFAGVSLTGVGQEILVDVALVVTPIVIIELLRRLGAGSIWSDVGEALLASRVPYRPYLMKLIGARIEALRDDVKSLAKKDGLIPDLVGLSRWLDDFFTLGGDTYKGIDSHVPSEYILQYKWFLDVHGKKAADSKGKRQDVRVIVATKTALTEDYENDSASYLRFLRWHADRGISLMWITPQEQGAIVGRIVGLEALATSDVALWEHFTVMFSTDESSDNLDEPKTALHVRFPRDTPARPLIPTYEALEKYVDAVVSASRPFPKGPPGLDVVDPVIAIRWADYVDVDERIRPDGKFAQFLKEAINDAEWILDAAAGIGCESIILQELGRGVVSNEVDANLSAQADLNADRHGKKLDIRHHSWQELPSALEGGGRFSAIVCLGNSLCLVRNKKQQSAILKGFGSKLHVGGRLVVDERNFKFMIDNADRIVSDPARHFPYLYGDPMYRGRRVRGVPISITASQIEWRLFDNSAERTTMREIHEVLLDTTPLVLRPFDYGELHEALQKAGFRVIGVYADLVKVSDGPMPDYSEVSQSAFFSYVAEML